MLSLYDLINKAELYDNIVIFGYYEVGIEVFVKMKTCFPKKNICFCDNNDDKINEKVLSVNHVTKKYARALYIITSLYFFNTMKRQLVEQNIVPDNIVWYVPKEYIASYELEMMIRRITPHTQLQFEVDLARHCNLNCKYCDHFSPLAEESFTDSLEYERSIKRLSQLFNGNAKRIYLLGGEPLLNREINQFIECTRKEFKKAEIGIVTNGLLLEKMTSDFWKCCKENDICIIMSKYPLKIEYEKKEALCTDNGVRFMYMNYGKVICDSHHYPIDIEGKQDSKWSFLHCSVANECITLKNGRLYTCSIAPNIDNFSKYYKLDIEESAEDSIDIFSVKCAQEIYDFLSRPIPLCRHCKVYARSEGNEWGISQKKIEEWI